MRTKIICIVLLILMLVGCKMGPNYMRQEQPGDEAWRLSSGTSESIANLPWWEVLHDEELQRLIRIALKENRDLKRAVASVEEYEARALIAKMDFAPQLSLSGNLPVAKQGGVRFPGFPTPFNAYAQGSLSWELDIWGRIRRSNEAALGDLLAQEANRRAVVLQLISSVAQSYMELRALDWQIEITTRTLKAWDETVRISQLRFQHGDIPELDLNQFEAERANAAAQLADLEQQVVQKENQLSVLLGHRPMSIPRGVSLADQMIPPTVPPGLPSDLLQRRPDIVQVEQQLAAVTARIGAAKAERFPRVTLTGILGVASPHLSRVVNPGQFAELGPSLAGPLFNAQMLGFQQKAVEAQARQALAQYQQTILSAFQDVENALTAVQKSREKRDAQEQQVAALQSALGFAGQRYQVGRASYLDVLTAQRSLFTAQLSLTDTRRAQLVSVVQLYKALGGGWSPETSSGPARPRTVSDAK
jgi:multidrug efflux system outer membrane protein